MRFILKYKGSYQKKSQRIYIKNCTMSDHLIEFIQSKVTKKHEDIILRHRSEKIVFRIIKGWSIDHYQLRQGDQIQIEFLEQHQKQLKIKYQNKYLLNLLGDQKKQLKQINEEQAEQQDSEQDTKKYFDVRQYLDSECEIFLKLVQKGKLHHCLKLLQELPDKVDEQYIMQIQRLKPKIINQLGEGGWGAIHYAVFCDKIDILNQLIKRDVDLNKITKDGWTALQLAINRKNFNIIKLLIIQPNININELTIKGTALHIACKLSDLQTMELLLNKQADWKLMDEKGKNCYEVCQTQEASNLLSKYQQKFHQKELQTNLFVEELVILKGLVFKAKRVFLTLKQRLFVLNPFEGTLIQYENEQNYPKKPKQIIPLTTIKELKFLKNEQKTWQMKKDYNYIDIYYPKRLLFGTKNFKIAERWYNGINDAVKYQKYLQSQKLLISNSTNSQKQIVNLDDKNNLITSNNGVKTEKEVKQLKLQKKQTIILSKNLIKSSDEGSDCMSPRMPNNPISSICSRPSQNNTSFGTQSSPRNRTFQQKQAQLRESQMQLAVEKVTKKQEYQRATKDLARQLKSITNEKINFSTFEILEDIGSGAFGKVYLAQHIHTKMIYALKALKKKTLILKKQLKYAISEANILKSANHPFIINLHYAFQTPNFLYLVLDYCPGKDLNFHLARQLEFSEDDARFYAAQLLLAIQHLHQKNILYRDLKPQNILLDAEGHIKLTDFGLSKDGVEQSKSFCGTLAYLSPQMLNQKGVGKQSDYYGIGCVLYEFLVGEPPYFSEDIPTLQSNIREGKLKFPKKISDDAKNLLMGLLQRDPKKRLGHKNKDQIKSHPFFAKIDWNALYQKRIPPPKREYDKDEVDSDDQIILKNTKVKFTDFDYQDSTKKINRLNGFSFVRS